MGGPMYPAPVIGKAWTAITALRTPLNAVPTTTAPLSIWNGEAQGGLCYVIDSIFLFNGVTQALASSFSLQVMMNVGAVAQPGGGVAITPKGTTGLAYAGTGVVQAGATVTNDVWFPFGTALVDVNSADTNIVLDVPVNGLYVVPPGGCFSVAALVATAPVATSMQVGIRWREHKVVKP